MNEDVDAPHSPTNFGWRFQALGAFCAHRLGGEGHLLDDAHARRVEEGQHAADVVGHAQRIAPGFGQLVHVMSGRPHGAARRRAQDDRTHARFAEAGQCADDLLHHQHG
jgi:hypothetical protein